MGNHDDGKAGINGGEASDVGIDNIKERAMLRLSTFQVGKPAGTHVSSRLQLNKRRNRAEIAATGLADDSPVVPSWNLAFPFALGA
jgi:hypothetical protein